MATVKTYDDSNWMAQAKGAHVCSSMSNVICWSHVWGFGTASTAYVSTGSDLLKARVRLSPSSHDVEYAYQDPHPYSHWAKFGMRATTVTADAGTIQACDAGVPRTVATCSVDSPGAMSGSFPVIIDGVCYWVEVGAAGGVPRNVLEVLANAGIMYS
uniref:Uncharacterized protein n=1 Tax=viral metagenome TaxID=1070528 RepID=A0A6H1ZLA8_9ZZZZ